MSRKHPTAADYATTTLRRVDWPTELDTVRRLFQDYRQWVAEHRDPDPAAAPRVTAGLQEIDRQIAGLPGEYDPPRGDVILAFKDGDVVACGSLRGLDSQVGEIKRIYVREDHRGPGFGPILTQALVDRASELRFERIRVDTLPTMYAAIQFYQKLGFRPIPEYWPHPAPGALFFERRIDR